MPRLARVIVPGYPHHVTRRGNRRVTVFFDGEDRQTYLGLLNRYSRRHDEIGECPWFFFFAGEDRQTYLGLLNRYSRRHAEIGECPWFLCLVSLVSGFSWFL